MARGGGLAPAVSMVLPSWFTQGLPSRFGDVAGHEHQVARAHKGVHRRRPAPSAGQGHAKVCKTVVDREVLMPAVSMKGLDGATPPASFFPAWLPRLALAASAA